MRRDEFEVKNVDYINRLLNVINFCTISLNDNNSIYSTAVNFAGDMQNIYFHSSSIGRKSEILEDDKYIAMTAIKEYSLIPSYFFNSEMACPATQFFASIYAEGFVKIINSYEEKIAAMKLIMEKLQSSKKYIELEDECYNSMINKILLVNIKINKISCKAKLGQNLTGEKLDCVKYNLMKRSSALDIETVCAMKHISEYLAD